MKGNSILKKFWNDIDYGDNIQYLIKNDDYMVMRLQEESGDGIMTIYNIFPGVILMFNDFHMGRCYSGFHTTANLLCIDHCREGCMEQEMEKNAYTYLEAGDFRIDSRINHSGEVTFPLNHYHGISIGINVSEAQESLKNELKGFSVNLKDLKRKYCEDKKSYVIRREAGISHIFSELYHVPVKIKKDYFRIKIFELLLYLDAVELDLHKKEIQYFYKGQVEKIKAIQKTLVEDLTTYYTIPELSKKFNISQTSLKNCFKAVYGNSIFRYMQVYRINVGASMLKKKRDMSISEIAASVGYFSPSKFTVAFRKIIGKTPLEYRKNIN